jgi:hypothetical protein
MVTVRFNSGLIYTVVPCIWNPGGKGGRCVRLTTYHLHVPMSRTLGALISWNPVGLSRPVMGQLNLLPLHLGRRQTHQSDEAKTHYANLFRKCILQAPEMYL